MVRSTILASGTTCPRTVLGMALAFCTCMVTPAVAAECVFPDNVDWVVNTSCEVSGIRIAPRNLSVIRGATLTIESTGEIILDMRNFRINIDPNSRIVVENGGRIRSNQIGPLLVRGTDGGKYGYFLKQVGGGFFDTINPDLSFYPSSTIKVLYMIEALRQVDSGSLNLTTTMLTSCPTTIVPGPGQTCPNSFSSAPSSGAGGNCDQPPVPNSTESCGAPTVAYGLGVGICAMMKVSNNPAANAIQDAVGSGNPQTGWNNMLNNAGAAIGLSATTLASRLGCDGPDSSPRNETTLRDLGLLYEQMATDAAVLLPSSLPDPFVFQDTDAYDFMENGNGSGFLKAIVDEQAAELGLDSTTISSFKAAVRYALKAGNNGNAFRSVGGWVSLPINGGSSNREYVYGFFINDVTVNSPPWPNNSRPVAAEMLRPVIRDALEDF